MSGRADYGHLEGTAFEPGAYTLAPHHAWLWSDAVGGDPAEGIELSAAYMIAMRAGASIELVMDLLETEPDRVLFGELGFRFEAALAVGRRYDVESEITAVERKSGSRLPYFDRVTLAYRIAEADGGRPVVTVSQIWIVGRDEEGAP